MSEEQVKQIMTGARSETKADLRLLIAHLFDDWVECHGDRVSGDDAAIITGWARLSNRAVAVIATNKGQELQERLQTHFGSPTPTGYRKALRMMQTAANLKIPILTLVNTPGAYPGADAEKAGQGQTIAQNLSTMLQLPVPILAIIIGEAGSGGALALDCADRVWMFAQSMYTVLSPEGFASIMYKDAHQAEKAAQLMHIEPHWLLEHQVVEAVLPESWLKDDFQFFKSKILQQLQEFDQLSLSNLLQQRQQRFRKF